MSDSALKRKLREDIKTYASTYTMVIALVLIWALFAVLTRISNGEWVYFSSRNISNLFRQMTIIGFLACGMVFVIVTGGIDLSVGALAGMISVIVAFMQARFLPGFLEAVENPVLKESLSVVITILVALLVGVIAGVWQGFLIAHLHIPPFVVTLGGQLIFGGGILFVTQGQSIGPIGESIRLLAQGYLPPHLGYVLTIGVMIALFWYIFAVRIKRIQYGFPPQALKKDLIKGSFFSLLILAYVIAVNGYRGIQNPVLLLGVVAVALTYLANNTRFGRYVYAIGGNREATRLSGINIEKNIFRVYVLMGILAGIAGTVLTGYVGSGSSNAGRGYELDTIAACVIGGTSLMGGSGTIFGALIGAIVMASIVNGMSVLNMDVYWQFAVKGLVLILAVFGDVAAKKRSS